MPADSTFCPNCGAISDYKINMINGRQVLQCRDCTKRFIAEVRQREFTGRNR
ncbi:hypothetical protein DFP90_101963 [Aestuariispira insulae]|uniref:Uncharacterized protein n=1 Tax=Aestuariispira insulae TaxID=1461337 RepID=A0A3D9HXL5_9PROT|nr:hypothetical protein DFP90_101963 [Aestuariispira insulae]